MPLSALSDRRAVLAAIAEYDALGRDAFLRKHRYGRAKTYFLVHNGQPYDSKAIAGVAVGKQFPSEGPLFSTDFSGGEATVKAKLEQLGFQVAGRGASPNTAPANGHTTTFAIAPTDRDWFEALRDTATGRLVNFWTPTPWRVTGLQPGARLYFLLKHPIRKVAGYGDFVRYEDNTVREAWRAFGPGNGVQSEAELLGRVARFAEKRSKTYRRSANPTIGCIVLRDIVTWDEDRWLRPDEVGHAFPQQVVKLKYFNDDDGFQARSSEINRMAAGDFGLVDGSPGRRMASTKDRKGQSAFRQLILASYDNRCCVSGTRIAELLEAAHIQPYVNETSNHNQNGLCLRVDIHRLFDAGLIAISPELTVVLSDALSRTNYAALAGKTVRLPKSRNAHPSAAALAFHRSQVFRSSDA
jgi:putative restriction endonuclease